jgi:two-component system invasion response regulator UvrY
MIRVLIADDHPIVRRGLRQIVGETPDLVVDAEAGSALEVIDRVRERAFEVVVLDLRLGASSGLEVLSQLRKERPRLPVLVLTFFTDEQCAVSAVRAGAAGFLTKGSAPERLLEAIRKCAGGGRYVTPEVAEQLASFVASDRPGAPHSTLSNRELQIFEALAGGKTVSEIARELHLSVKTISTHRARLLAKMHMRTNAELTRYAVKNALVP